MTKKEIFISFLFYSILGWAIDTATRSLQTGEFTQGNWLGVPFSPMYGIAVIGIILLYQQIKHWELWKEFVFFAFVSATYEYIGGVFSSWALGYRLWDYYSYPLNINGHTDPFHAVGWGFLCLAVVYLIHPWLKRHIVDWTGSL